MRLPVESVPELQAEILVGSVGYDRYIVKSGLIHQSIWVATREYIPLVPYGGWEVFIIYRLKTYEKGG